MQETLREDPRIQLSPAPMVLPKTFLTQQQEWPLPKGESNATWPQTTLLNKTFQD